MLRTLQFLLIKPLNLVQSILRECYSSVLHAQKITKRNVHGYIYVYSLSGAANERGWTIR